MSTCLIDGCEKPPCNIRGWCNGHYLKFLKYGDPNVSKVRRAGPCSISGCKNTAKAHKLCYKHLRRKNLYGDPLGGRPEQVTPGTVKKYLLETVLNHSSDECLLWPYALVKGYPGIRIDGKQMYAHRYVCKETQGPPPTTKHEAAHTCGVPRCCNPRHLKWATRAENEADKEAHGTRVRGEAHPWSKLSAADKREIRRLHHVVPCKVLAERFGVSVKYVNHIQNRR